MTAGFVRLADRLPAVRLAVLSAVRLAVLSVVPPAGLSRSSRWDDR